MEITSLNLLVFSDFRKFCAWLAPLVYAATVVLLFHYFLKYYYYRCIIQTEVHPLRIFPVRCRRFRVIRRFLWFFIIVPFVYKRATRTLKFFFRYNKQSWPDRAALRTYFYILVVFVYFFMRVDFDIYWDQEWEEVKFFYYLHLCDVYYAHLDTPELYCLGVD